MCLSRSRVLVFLLAVSCHCLAQQTVRAIEISSIHENRSADEQDRGIDISGPKMTGTNLSLRTLILQAYGVLDFQVIGGPAWLSTARFDVNTIAEGAQPIADAEFGPMLQRLLAERFHLSLHHETRQMKEYVLLSDPKHLSPNLRLVDGRPLNSMSGSNQNGKEGTAKMVAQGVAMSALAYRIAVQKPFRGNLVIDKTGLSGNYDFTLEWEAGDNAASSLIRSLQEQLGLRMIYERMPVDVLVIDQAEKPSEN